MKYSTKLSDTVHVMVLIAINKEKSLSSASIAESVHTNPGFVWTLSAIEALERDFSLLMAIRTIT